MRTKLDHLYGNGKTISALDKKIRNLSNITVKNNISNQVIPQQQINSTPTHVQNIVRLAEVQHKRIIYHSSTIAANTLSEWTPANLTLTNNKIYQFVIKLGVNNADYIFDWNGFITNTNYKNMGPIFSFAVDNNNFTETCKVKFWIDNNKIKMLCNISVNNVVVYMKNGYHE